MTFGCIFSIINPMKTPKEQLPTDIKTLQNLLLEARSLLAVKSELLLKKEAQLEAFIEQLRLSRAQRFAPSSEKQCARQGELFDEAEHILATEEAEPEAPIDTEDKDNTNNEADKTTPYAYGRRVLPAHLKRVDMIHDLDDADKFCPHDGSPLHKIGEEISEQLEIIPASIHVVHHRRFKYGCRCCEQGVHTANLPKQAFPKSNATAGTVAYIAVSKYQDALPLYRLESMFKRNKVHIPRNTMAGWMIKLGQEVLCHGMLKIKI